MPKKSLDHYKKLHTLSKHTQTLKGISSLLDWDAETHMPAAAATHRAEQLKILSGIIHREKTSPSFKKALSQLIDLESGEILAKDLPEQNQAALREWKIDYQKNIALPIKFVEELSQLQSQAIIAWRSAKEHNAFLQFAPFLDRLIQMNRQKADYLGYEEHPYDALIGEYEPDTTTKEIDSLFSKLKAFLIPKIKEVSKKKINLECLVGDFNELKQMEFSRFMLKKIGYDLDQKGRIDFSSHPFSSAPHPTDSRITTRIDPKSFISNILTLLHESGHAFYEMNLPIEHFGSPLGESRSLGVHESQSKWWETQIGLSLPFWNYFFPLLQETFPEQLNATDVNEFHVAINQVTPSLIRVEADELTYPLHIHLRFELEKGLIDGKIKVKELPDIWDHKMEAYLGIKPPTNSKGCLQDIHWAMGAFGYFPTYTLGNLYCAHLFEAFSNRYPNWGTSVASGEFQFIHEWLKDNVHSLGRFYSTQNLLLKATSKPFDETAYLSYLNRKYPT